MASRRFVDLSTTLGDLPGAVTRTESRWYSYGGELMLSSVADDMITEQSVITTYSYDANGCMTEMVSTRETAEVLYTYRTTFAYDAQGRMTRQKWVDQVDRYKDGWIDEQSIDEITYAYDASGNKISKVEDRYNDSYLRTTTYAYDASGRLTAEDYKRTRRGSETVAQHETIAYAHDTAGRLVQKVITVYTIDSEGIETPSSINSIGFTYDADGRLVGFSYEDYDNGTVMDEQIVAAMTYDAAGTSASGTVESFSLDEATGTMTSDGPAKTISFTFAAEAPTATMEFTVQQFPLSSYTESFEELSLSVDIPALYGLYYGSQMVLGPNNRMRSTLTRGRGIQPRPLVCQWQHLYGRISFRLNKSRPDAICLPKADIRCWLDNVSAEFAAWLAPTGKTRSSGSWSSRTCPR